MDPGNHYGACLLVYLVVLQCGGCRVLPVWTLYTYAGICAANAIDLDHAIPPISEFLPEAGRHNVDASVLTTTGSSHLLFLLHYFIAEIMFAVLVAALVIRSRGGDGSGVECALWGLGVGLFVHSAGDRVACAFQYAPTGLVATAIAILASLAAVCWARWRAWGFAVWALAVVAYLSLDGVAFSIHGGDGESPATVDDVRRSYLRATPAAILLTAVMTGLHAALMHWLDGDARRREGRCESDPCVAARPPL